MLLVEMPILDDSRTWMISACGELQTSDPAVIKKIKRFGDKRKFAVVSNGNNTEYLEVYAGGKTGDTKHIHVNVYSSKIIGTKPTKVNSTVKEIADFLEEFFGEPISVTISGKFMVSTSELPERGMIRSAMTPAESGDMKITQTEATFSIVGNPVSQIHWFANKDATEVRTEVSLDSDIIIEEGYLKKIHQLAIGAFRKTVMGEKFHENG